MRHCIWYYRFLMIILASEQTSLMGAGLAIAARKPPSTSPSTSMNIAGALLQGIVNSGQRSVLTFVQNDDLEKLKTYVDENNKLIEAYTQEKDLIHENSKKTILKHGQELLKAKELYEKKFISEQASVKKSLERLYKSAIIAKPLEHYLDAWIDWDRIFETSPMALIDTVPWYNLLGPFSSQTNWLYDQNTQMFMQLNKIPVYETLFWNISSEKRDLLKQDPSLFHIFTEYATDKRSYPIEIECTVLDVTYPFFVGVLFNRARWISGDPERLWWYRLAGIYGVRDTQQKDGSTSTFHIAELIMSKEKDKPTQLISPLEQVMKGNSLVQHPIDAGLVKDIGSKKVILVFKINNSAAQYTITLDYYNGPRATTKPQNLYKETITSAAEWLFKFHGIGFLALNCKALYKVIQPPLHT